MRTFVCTFLLMAGCKPHAPADGTKQEEKILQATVWNERFEVFLEHAPVVTGRPTPFAAHITDLATSRPRAAGKLIFILESPAGPVLEHVEQEPRRPGIYVPDLTFPSAGTWKIRLRIPLEEGESTLELPPATVYAGPEEARKAPAPESPEGIRFLKEQQWRLSLRTEIAGTRRLVERWRLPAVVSARSGGRVALAPPLSGRLLAPGGKVLPGLGTRVESGELLALVQLTLPDLAARILDAEAEVTRTGLRLQQAQRVHERTLKLAEGQAKTEREVEESRFALEAAQAAHQAARALKAAYEKSGLLRSDDAGGLPCLELRSPVTGLITQVGASPGEYVTADRPVFTIVDASRVHLEARVPESDAGRLGASREAVYETPDSPGRFFSVLGEGGGRLVLWSPEVDAATRTIPLVYEVPNPDGRLRIGMALTLHLETARSERAVAVPESALVDEEGRFVAFVQVAGETFQKRDLRTGLRDSGFVEILEGLSAGERVVTRGAYAVRLASVSASLPAHGHTH